MATASNKILLILGMLILTGSFCGCGDERCSTPIGEAYCVLEPDSPLYYSLNTVGGYEYLVGGHRGLVVIRTALDEFVCYERSCPACHDVAVEVSKDWGSGVLECPQCGSRFSVYTEGVPLDGSITRCPLYQYSTTYDGFELHIW